MLGELKRMIKVMLWWLLLPRGPRNEALEELTISVALRIGAKPFKKVRIVESNELLGAAVIATCKEFVITRGLLNLLTREELEGVLLHEYAHCVHRHGIKLLSLAIAPVASLTLTAALLAGPAGIAASLASVMAYVLAVRYVSRRFEVRADLYALERSSNPGSYIEALRKLARADEGSKKDRLGRLLLAHPPINERIRLLEALLHRKCGGPGGT